MLRVLSRFMWFCAGVLLLMVFTEGFLRLLPVSTGLHRTSQFERWPLQYTEPRFRYVYSITWSMLNAHRGVTNNYGHVAPFDFEKDSRPTIVIGDSFIESLMNDYQDTLQGQLGRKLGAPKAVYGLGVSGMSVSDYVALARLARGEFRPVAAIILITDGDLSESLIPGTGSYFLVPGNDGLELRYTPIRGDSVATRVRRVIGDLSIHRYFQINLQFLPDELLKRLWKSDTAKQPANQLASGIDGQKRVVDWFLDELPSGFGVSPECVVLLLDSDRYAIYKPEFASSPKDSPEVRRYLVAQATHRGFKVSDLDSVFRQHFARDKMKFDHWPIDRHWNKVGHGVGAEEAYRLLTESDPQRTGACLAAKRFAD